MIYLFTLIFLIFVALAGISNAIMDLIQPLDKLSYKGYKWTKAAMEENKDRNKDGNISFWENAFPNDIWHKAKRLMGYSMGLACSTLLGIGYCIKDMQASNVQLVFLSLFATPIYFFVISFTFEKFYTYYRKNKL